MIEDKEGNFSRWISQEQRDSESQLLVVDHWFTAASCGFDVFRSQGRFAEALAL